MFKLCLLFVFERMLSVVKSSVFDTLELENVVADVLHGNKSTDCELPLHLSKDTNSEVMPSPVQCLYCVCQAQLVLRRI